MFTLDEATFINQPNALHGLLHSMFNPVTAQAVFNLFMQMRPKFVQQAALTGNGVPTYNLGDPQYGVQGGAEGYAARLAYEERREQMEERRFDKYMRNMMMFNMQKMMGAQTPMIGDPGMMGGGMGAIREEIDEKTSKVTGRSFVPGAGGGGGVSMSDGMLRVTGDQNKMLLQSQMDQLREMKDMFNSVLKNNQTNQNPLAVIEQFKNAGLIPDPNKPQSTAPESIESINARLDAQVKLLTMKMEMEKVRHDWNIQREDKIAQSENTKEWVGTIKDIIEHNVKPTLGEFAKGYGEAMARQKWEAEQQKVMAMQEQQVIQQQQRARAAAMNRQRMGGVPPQQQQQRQQQRPQQVIIPPQQQQQQFYPQQEPQEQQPSRHQQEVQKNMINEERIAQMSMEEIDNVEEEILQGISMARPLYIRLEQEKKKRLSQISGNRQQAQQQQQPQQQQQTPPPQEQPSEQQREGNETSS
jgi:hypothetical protein